MYKIGEKIVYPSQGACIVDAVVEKTIMGKKKQYYVLKIASGNLTVSIPVDNCDKLGVRCVISREEAKNVLEYFKNAKTDDTVNWNKRQRENIAWVKSGDIYKAAHVLKELMVRDARRGLSTGERKLLSGTRQIIISELVLSGLGTKEEIDEIMSDIVEVELNG